MKIRKWKTELYTHINMITITNLGFFLLSGKGFYMHFRTATAQAGDRAFLETQMLYPKPGSQCLQFFLHNTAATDDVLNIWVREYDKDNPNGRQKLFKAISGKE